MTLRKIIVLYHHIIPIRVLIQNKNNNTTRIPNNKKNRRKKNNSGIINTKVTTKTRINIIDIKCTNVDIQNTKLVCKK